MSLTGKYYRAHSSEQVSAKLFCEGQALRFQSGGEILQELSIEQCQLSAPIGRMPYRIELPNGDCFECEDHQAIEAIFAEPNASRLVHYWEKSRGFALAALVMLPIIALLYIKVGMPLAAKVLAPQIPKEALLALDNQALQQLQGYFHESKLDEDGKRLLESAWQRLPNQQRYTLLSKSSPGIGANAFALPGGHILVTDELVTALNNENEILAVLAHEAGHVEQYHGIRNIIQSLGTVALLSVIVGDVSVLAETVLVSGPVIFQQLSYSRDLEREADHFSIEMLEQINVPSSCLGAGLTHLMAAHDITLDTNNVGDIVIEDAKPKEQEPIDAAELLETLESDDPKNDASATEPNSDDAEKDNKEEQELDWKEKLKKQMGWDEEFDLRDALNYLSTHPGTEERVQSAGGIDCPAPQ
ncbi:M48 family metallopeptidase [uncultured Pseudoteredinibacter sp.]|uniref:M48 family metallopeptidase n=1 Tax=uncultured Pseudoteredinibacter sp. TaxID=1641701 RepID=UPI00262F53B6|nr:M48 family metallopeptidase [uncultured Pseudoteredinibacter sp.]